MDDATPNHNTDTPPTATPDPEQAPMPTKGGCYVRLPDGSLVPDEAAHPTEAQPE